MENQLELIDKGDKTQKVNVQDMIITYPVDDLIQCLPDDKIFGICSQISCTSKTHE